MNKDGVDQDKLIDYLETQIRRAYLTGYSEGLYVQNKYMNIGVIVIVLIWFVVTIAATLWQTILACGAS